MTTSLSKSELGYILSSLALSTRADGRQLHAFRSVSLTTGVAPLANGSAEVALGRDEGDSAGGGTVVTCGVRFEVEDISSGGEGEGSESGRVSCTATCAQSAYPSLSPPALEDVQADLTTLLNSTLAHSSLLPQNLRILPRKKAWAMYIDVLVLADAGNVLDAMFTAARAAVWDARVPRTRGVVYRRARAGGKTVDADAMDTTAAEDIASGGASGFDVRRQDTAGDFELVDDGEEGDVLDGREAWPICVTLNVFDPTSSTPSYFLDATLAEQTAAPLRLLLILAFPDGLDAAPVLQGVRTLGTSEVRMDMLSGLIEAGQGHATELAKGVRSQLRAEDVRRTEKARQKFGRGRVGV